MVKICPSPIPTRWYFAVERCDGYAVAGSNTESPSRADVSIVADNKLMIAATVHLWRKR